MYSKVFLLLAIFSTCFVTHVSAKCRMQPCPLEWHHWGTSCYLVTQSSFTWSSARAECAELGGILAVPSSLEETEFIVNVAIPDAKDAWIDCNDQAIEGTWMCKEAGGVEVSYRNWDDAQPNNWGDQDCAMISRRQGSRRKWHDHSCSKECRAVCKQPTYSHVDY